jgi:hypothetical protein
MSNILVRDIVGQGTYAVPETGAALSLADAGFETLLSGVALLNWVNVRAIVEDTEGGSRILSCKIEEFAYNTSECPSESVLDGLSTAIKNALEASASITTVGVISYDMFRG